jgi:hypothetical protein
MRKIVSGTVLVVLMLLVSVIGVAAQDEQTPIYYVNLQSNYNAAGDLCMDGSERCPFNTLVAAINKGQTEICEGRTFDVYRWNGTMYVPYGTFDGRKSLPAMGAPIAQVLLIIIAALVGVALLILALRLRRKLAV